MGQLNLQSTRKHREGVRTQALTPALGQISQCVPFGPAASQLGSLFPRLLCCPPAQMPANALEFWGGAALPRSWQTPSSPTGQCPCLKGCAVGRPLPVVDFRAGAHSEGTESTEGHGATACLRLLRLASLRAAGTAERPGGQALWQPPPPRHPVWCTSCYPEAMFGPLLLCFLEFWLPAT